MWRAGHAHPGVWLVLGLVDLICLAALLLAVGVGCERELEVLRLLG